VKSLGGRTIFTLTSPNDPYVGQFVENVHTAAKILVPATGALIRDLRAALGADVALVGPDGFNVIDDLLKLAGTRRAGYVRQQLRDPE
jgi:hypothetical protein